jgi:hypothetical protein
MGSGINFAMDKCDEGHSEWAGWWGTLAGMHMLIGLVLVLAPTNILPYHGTVGLVTPLVAWLLPSCSIFFLRTGVARVFDLPPLARLGHAAEAAKWPAEAA